MCRMEDTTLAEISFMGHVLEDKAVKEEARYRYPPVRMIQALWMIFTMIKVSKPIDTVSNDDSL